MVRRSPPCGERKDFSCLRAKTQPALPCPPAGEHRCFLFPAALAGVEAIEDLHVRELLEGLEERPPLVHFDGTD
jgi:hypothetical protein